MTTTWVDFKELRAKLRFSDVLKSYNVDLKVKGDRATGFCPLPGHNGNRRSPSFSANLAKGVFQCFGCGAKGNVLDFASFMQGVDPTDSAAFRRVALDLQDRFGFTMPRPAKPQEAPAQKAAESKTGVPPAQTAPEKKRIVNAPIDFELKKLDAGHPYLSGRGFIAPTIDRFGLGFCSRGLMAGRIAIALHDSTGKLIGYAGRIVDDTMIGQDHPKYRFPGERERDGVISEFRKSLFLYNGHRITAPVADLIVVEGFPSVWWTPSHQTSRCIGWAVDSSVMAQGKCPCRARPVQSSPGPRFQGHAACALQPPS
jgi:DNA primase